MIISGAARLAGIFGWPIAHSRSPLIHNHWLAAYGIDGAYLPFAVQPDDLAAALSVLAKLGIGGVNLTIPHKEAALPLLDQVDAAARRIGAVNTIVVQADGGLHGSNTDAFGFLEGLRETLPGWTGREGPAVVLGAGGAARAVIVALTDCGAPEVRIVNRTRARAEALAAELGGPLGVCDWSERDRTLAEASLLVNATSLGMRGGASLDIGLEALPAAAIVCDIVYVPLKTPLLAAAEARGHPTVDGLAMLLHQARPGFAAWFGRDPDVTAALRASVAASLDR